MILFDWIEKIAKEIEGELEMEEYKVIAKSFNLNFFNYYCSHNIRLTVAPIWKKGNDKKISYTIGIIFTSNRIEEIEITKSDHEKGVESRLILPERWIVNNDYINFTALSLSGLALKCIELIETGGKQ